MTGIVVRKVSQSANFKESVQYVLRQGRYDEKEQPAFWGVLNLAPGEHRGERLAWEMRQTFEHRQRLRELAGSTHKGGRDCTTPVMHRLISYGDYKPTRDEVARDVQSLCVALGIERQEVVWAAHADTENFHVHLIVNKVSPETGKVVDLTDDYRKADAWRLQWNAAHHVVTPDNDNKSAATSTNAKSRVEWNERQRVKAEVFAEAARQLHRELNAEQAAELREFCKEHATEWTQAAMERTQDDVREAYAIAYEEAELFIDSHSEYVAGYWITEFGVGMTRRGRLFMKTKRRWVRGYGSGPGDLCRAIADAIREARAGK